MAKTYTERDLVKFGNYLLSKERSNSIHSNTNAVHHADLANWKDRRKSKSK